NDRLRYTDRHRSNTGTTRHPVSSITLSDDRLRYTDRHRSKTGTTQHQASSIKHHSQQRQTPLHKPASQ
ncbi:MAG: hypothetical protein QGF00_00425, partial [Planctomycetota bacterium]|nr:hypothetical protein [Planctomycetota bacterium]